jgi:hypothetical protein
VFNRNMGQKGTGWETGKLCSFYWSGIRDEIQGKRNKQWGSIGSLAESMGDANRHLGIDRRSNEMRR